MEVLECGLSVCKSVTCKPKEDGSGIDTDCEFKFGGHGGDGGHGGEGGQGGEGGTSGSGGEGGTSGSGGAGGSGGETASFDGPGGDDLLASGGTSGGALVVKPLDPVKNSMDGRDLQRLLAIDLQRFRLVFVGPATDFSRSGWGVHRRDRQDK
jgi:hypothetical protein